MFEGCHVAAAIFLGRYHPVAVDILAAVLQGRIAAFCATRPSYEGLPFYK
jgi:hypothetical protein